MTAYPFSNLTRLASAAQAITCSMPTYVRLCIVCDHIMHRLLYAIGLHSKDVSNPQLLQAAAGKAVHSTGGDCRGGC